MSRQWRIAVAEWRIVRDGLEVVELTEHVSGAASELAARHALSGADAVHLASALELGDGAVVAV